MIAVSCTLDEPVLPEEGISFKVPELYHAAIDNKADDTETRVYADADFHILWNADDRITCFPKVTYGYEYRFTGNEGDNFGDFEPVDNNSGGYSTGNSLDWHFAVYPYQKDTRINNNGVISFTLPSVQAYRPNSFGVGANTMVARTPDTFLKFKNACGYLLLSLYGNNVTVSSITLEAINGEPIAGLCTIDMSTGLPVVTMDSNQGNVSSKIKIDCSEDPVTLGSSDDPTNFCFVVPPVVFEGGFKITVRTPDGGVFSRSAAIANFEIKRNIYETMKPLAVTNLDYPGDDFKINGISSNAGGYGVTVKKSNGSIYYNNATLDESTRTFTITLPTVTDFSKQPFNYDLVEGDVLMLGDQVIQSGDSIDVSQPVLLKLCRGDAEMQYTLVAKNTGLPVVRITTDPFTRETVESDRVYVEGTGWGQRTKIDERVWRPSETAVDSSAFVTFESADGTEVTRYQTQIKGRGNATWKYNKRPYALKLLKKNEVFGMPKHKRWVLLANWKDRTLLRNDAAFWLSRQSGLPYTVRGMFVELEFNGEHRGNYYLCEQIKPDANRVNIKEWSPKDSVITGGFLMEIDNNYDEANKFKSSQYNLKYMFKDPDDDLTTEAINYMKNFVNNTEVKIKNAANSGAYRDDFDIDASIWFMFVNELTGNGDFYNENYSDEYKGPHSTYLYKAKGGKLTMGPVWDFDYLTFMTDRDAQWAGANQSGYYYKSLIKDSVYKERLRELWNLYKTDISGFESYITTMAGKIAASEEFNTTMWGYSNTSQDQGQNKDNTLSFEAAVDRMKTAFSNKMNWMDQQFSKSNFAF